MQFGQQTKQGMNKKMSCAALIEFLLAWSNKAAVKWTRSSRQTEIELPSLNVVKIYLNLFLICVHMRCICSRSFPSQFRMAFFLQLFAAWRFFAKTYKKRIWKKSKKTGKIEGMEKTVNDKNIKKWQTRIWHWNLSFDRKPKWYLIRGGEHDCKNIFPHFLSCFSSTMFD